MLAATLQIAAMPKGSTGPVWRRRLAYIALQNRTHRRDMPRLCNARLQHAEICRMRPSTIILEVYARRGGVHGREFVGTAEVPASIGDVLEITSADGSIDRVAIGTMTVMPVEGDLTSGPVILLERGQRPELLPSWRPLANHHSDVDVAERVKPLPIFGLPRFA